MKYLRVDVEMPHDSQSVFEELAGDETDEQLDRIAADCLATLVTYGYSVVDESEVPEDER